jgi:hypothetical protein
VNPHLLTQDTADDYVAGMSRVARLVAQHLAADSPSTGASVADLAPVVDGVDLDRPAGQVEDRARSITPRDRRLVHRLVVLCSWMSRQHPSQQGHELLRRYDADLSFTTNHGEPLFEACSFGNCQLSLCITVRVPILVQPVPQRLGTDAIGGRYLLDRLGSRDDFLAQLVLEFLAKPSA